MPFLPNDYSVPSGESNYMKFKKGDNRFRILSSAIVGWEYWTNSNKPIRARSKWEKTPEDARLEEDGSFKPRHFWAFLVFNYETKGVQVLEVTQKQIMKSMKVYLDNEKWGDPKGYDFVVRREGDGFETEYTVAAEPHSTPPIPMSEVPEADLEALFVGGDPFAK